MTSHPRPARHLCAFLLVLAAALPLGAAERSHAVRLAKITITGVVTDATTGTPVKGAQVVSGDVSAVTDDLGRYTLTVLKNAVIVVTRPGYVTTQKEASAATLNFALPQTANVTVKTSGGQTLLLDIASLKFGYAQLFQGYASGDSPSLCRVNGSEREHWEPAKSEIKRIIGPAHSVTAAACCDRGPVMAIDVELKSGQTATGYLEDNCFGYSVEVIGIERNTGITKFIPLTEVTEIVFP